MRVELGDAGNKLRVLEDDLKKPGEAERKAALEERSRLEN